MISIATFNTWKSDGAYRERLPLMAQQLIGWDIIALQESFCSENISTSAYIAKELGFAVLDEPARSKPRMLDGNPVSSTSGLAVISRWPLRSLARIQLPEDPRDGERIAQAVICATPLGPMVLINTHLCHLPGSDELRRAQLAAITEWWREQSAQHAVLCGDFNADPHSPVITNFTDSPGLYPIDACATCETRFATLVNSSRRIDYIFLIQRDSKFEFVSACRVSDQNCTITCRLPSDNFAVGARIRRC